MSPEDSRSLRAAHHSSGMLSTVGECAADFRPTER
jgi:hypothetical protein